MRGHVEVCLVMRQIGRNLRLECHKVLNSHRPSPIARHLPGRFYPRSERDESQKHGVVLTQSQFLFRFRAKGSKQGNSSIG